MPTRPSIDPKTEFIGHCSNLQVWVENGYNTQLLHRSLSFPVLKELTKLGDPMAKRMFKDEIGRRYVEGVESTRTFLFIQGYLDYLSVDEFESLGVVSSFDIKCLESVGKVYNKHKSWTSLEKEIYWGFLTHFFHTSNYHTDYVLICILKQVPEEMRYRFIKDMTLKTGLNYHYRSDK